MKIYYECNKFMKQRWKYLERVLEGQSEEWEGVENVRPSQ